MEEAAYYARVYPQGYRHNVWPDHVERVAASVELIRRYAGQIRTAADLSCGDGAILRGLAGRLPQLHHVYLGDLNGLSGQVTNLTAWRQLRRAIGVTAFPSGILPSALEQLTEPVDLYVLSETLEHMPDPDDLLRQIRLHSRYLFLSTPIDEPEGSGNLEHYWGWGPDDIHDMLQAAGWHPLERQLLVPRSTLHLPDAYTYQLWMAVSR